MPYGWALWLRAQPQPATRPHALPAEVAGLLAQQPAPARPRAEELPPWRAFVSLFRQGWLPPPRDELLLRWTSRIGSLLLHVLFVVFLAWIAYLQSLLPPPPPEAGGGGERVQIGFVGAGDPGTPRADADQAPSGPPGEPAPPAAAAAAPAAAAVAAPAETQSAPPVPQVEVATPAVALSAPALPDLAVREVPEPSPPPPAAEQPVQVTEVEQPTIDYVLPPTTPPEIQLAPAPVEPELREREVAVVQAPAVAAPQPRPLDIPLPLPRAPELRAREVDEPMPQVEPKAVAVRGPQVEARLPAAPESSVRQREVAMPSPPSTATAAAPTAASTAPTGTAQAAPAQGPAAAPAGASGNAPGAAVSAAPGGTPATERGASSGWETPLAGDDWGQASSGQARPGGAPGLFDDQGRVQLPGEGTGPGPGAGPGKNAGDAGEGVADRGAPGGDNDNWSRSRLDESGTWLKRPPYDYEPTSFDRYWVPNESLLADWVRKGIKSVAIPIPGTNKKINCVVSLLQLGGGCGITDPNLNEQPSDGRPPPDIPFKPELQEDNGSAPS